MKRFKGLVLNPSSAFSSASLAGWLLIIIITCFCGQESVAASRQIHYLHVEANEGNASGGHTAIRFDNETFHFQHETSGLIRIKRFDAKSFNHTYAVLGNRAIRESSIDVSAETFNLLLDGFEQFLIIQDEQLNILNNLQRDVTLFKILVERTREPHNQAGLSSLPLKGVGYFLSDDQLSVSISAEEAFAEIDTSHSSQTLRDLKSHVMGVYGKDYIEQRITRAVETLRTMTLSAAEPDLPGLSPGAYPPFKPFASTSYDDALMSFYALQLLQAGPKLMPGSYWANAGPVFQLTREDSRFLRSFAVKLEGDLLRLLDSSRSDWGFPFIIGMARLASIEASLASGRLVFLDVYPEADQQLRSKPLGELRYLPAMRQEAEELFLLKRKEFFSGHELREADYAALELLGNDLMELERSIESDVQPRRLSEASIPSRLAWLSDFVRPDMSEGELRQELESALTAENEYASALSRLYEYDLLRRNCVTEIFAFINKSLLGSSAGKKKTGQDGAMADMEVVKDESLHRLGGYIDAAKGLNFIPAVSAAEVDTCYTVTAKRELPSYRSAKLAEMKKQESPLLVFLRESNTVTSTIYHRPPDDSPFLFFTDDTVLLRPLFGAVNLIVGVGESLLGLVTLPVEGSNRLYLGAKGILFSLPELVFVNLRKGTMEYAAEHRVMSQ